MYVYINVYIFESCLKSSSDHGAICIKLDLVEGEKVFSMKEIHA